MRKVDNPERKVIPLIVDADTERCGCIACRDMCVEITHFSRSISIFELIIYMKKFLHSNWLRAVQFFFLNSAEKS